MMIKREYTWCITSFMRLTTYLAVAAPGSEELDEDTVLLRGDDRVEVIGGKVDDLAISCQEKTRER
jgi:hypothetical protein